MKHAEKPAVFFPGYTPGLIFLRVFAVWLKNKLLDTGVNTFFVECWIRRMDQAEVKKCDSNCRFCYFSLLSVKSSIKKIKKLFCDIHFLILFINIYFNYLIIFSILNNDNEKKTRNEETDLRS